MEAEFLDALTTLAHLRGVFAALHGNAKSSPSKAVTLGVPMLRTCIGDLDKAVVLLKRQELSRKMVWAERKSVQATLNEWQKNIDEERQNEKREGS